MSPKATPAPAPVTVHIEDNEDLARAIAGRALAERKTVTLSPNPEGGHDLTAPPEDGDWLRETAARYLNRNRE